MQTQDGYDWPNPNPSEPAQIRPSLDLSDNPKWNCPTCADTHVLRWPRSPTNPYGSRIDPCPVCRPLDAHYGML